MSSGVSPCGACHMSSPRSRLIAESTPYGGFTIGRLWMVRPPSEAAGGLAVGGGAVDVLASRARSAVRGASAAQQSPGPSTSRNGCPATPETYRMSENPAGGATSDLEPGVLPAGAKTMCSSGSYPPPGQFVAVPPTIAPMMPLTLPRTAGLNGGGAHLYRLRLWSAAARMAGAHSSTSSCTLT